MTTDASRLFRDVMGRFATGVTVVAAQTDDGPRAMTANAVSSLSLEPMLLLVCVQRDASMHRVLTEVGAFAVNILARDQRDLSDLFARHGELDQPMGGAPYRSGRTGAPILDGVLAWAECEVADRLPGGDHTIVVGRVVAAAAAPGEQEPLVFFGGRYRTLAPATD